MKHLITLAWLAAALPAVAQANVVVKLSSGEPVLQAAEPVRWQQVLAALPGHAVNAPFSVLNKPAALAELEQLRSRVLARLHQLSQHWHHSGEPALAYAATELKGQLEALPLVARQPVSFDYDEVRLYAGSNPRLRGEFELLLRSRPDYVRAQGLVRLPGKRPFVGGAYAYDYGQRLVLLPGANEQTLYVIQANGEVVHSGTNPFNPEFVGVSPGATLFVGFASLPERFAGLEQDMITLFANQKPE